MTQTLTKGAETRIANRAKLYFSEILAIHGDTYDYTNTVYTGRHKKLTVRCKVHGDFTIEAGSHLLGSGCAKCYNARRSSMYRATKDEFIAKAEIVHPNKYTYDRVDYLTCKDKVTITCPEHGDFEQTPDQHLASKGGCIGCNGGVAIDLAGFIERAKVVHCNLYSYNNTIYVNSVTQVNIECKKHGEFYQKAGNHLLGKGCAKCRKSLKEEALLKFVQSVYEGEIVVNSRKIISPLELDIYLPELKVAIEFNGIYFHSDKFPNAVNKQSNKTKMCDALGIRLIHVFEDDWEYKQEVVCNLITNALGLQTKRTYARSCEAVDVTKLEAKLFLDMHHMQGSSRGGVSIGLKFNGELVAVMQFTKCASARASKEYEYELIRYATECSVVGGASKLLSNFIRTHNPQSIVSYSDKGTFSGGMYEKLGFLKISESKPDYKVVEGKRRYHKSNYKRSNLLARFGDRFNPELSERENCHNLGLWRIYNSGLIKWVLNLTPTPK